MRPAPKPYSIVQLHTDWAKLLQGLLDRCQPLHSEIWASLGQGQRGLGSVQRRGVLVARVKNSPN